MWIILGILRLEEIVGWLILVIILILLCLNFVNG